MKPEMVRKDILDRQTILSRAILIWMEYRLVLAKSGASYMMDYSKKSKGINIYDSI